MPTPHQTLPHKNAVYCDYLNEHISRDRTDRILSHPYAELIAIRQGEIIYTARGETRRLGDRAVIYNRAGLTHNQFVQEHRLYERYKIFFCTDAPADDATLRRLLDTPNTVKELSAEDFDLIFALCTHIHHVSNQAEPSALALAGCRHALALALLRLADAEDRHESHEQTYLVEVMKYINRHLSERLVLEDIAAAFFISKSKLTYDFKSYFNMSIHEYITAERIEKAKELLAGGYLVGVAAQALGFSSTSYFIKVFVAATGQTPLKWQLQQTKKQAD